MLPPLTLLPLIAKGKVTSDMKWALPLIDRAKAGQEQNLQEQQQITLQLNALAAAGEQANDAQAFKTAQTIAGDMLAEEELTQPTVAMLGGLSVVPSCPPVRKAGLHRPLLSGQRPGDCRARLRQSPGRSRRRTIEAPAQSGVSERVSIQLAAATSSASLASTRASARAAGPARSRRPAPAGRRVE